MKNIGQTQHYKIQHRSAYCHLNSVRYKTSLAMIGVVLDLIVFLLGLLLLPLLVLLFLPCYIWRQTVKVLARLFKAKELGAMLSPLDATFIPFESPETRRDPDLHLNPDYTVCNVMIFKGTLDLDTFRAGCVEDILNARGEDGKASAAYDRFQQHVTTWLGYAFYKWDAAFDILDHVRVVQEAVTEDSLCQFVRARQQAPWRKASMWEMNFVHNYNGEDKTLFVLRFCHVVADGLSFMKMIQSRISSAAAFQGPAHSGSGPRPAKVLPLSVRMKNLYLSTLGLPRLFLQEIAELSRNAYITAEPTAGSTEDPDPRWISITDKIPVADLKGLKTRAGISFSEAMSTAIFTAVGKHVRSCLGVKDKKWITGATVFPGRVQPSEGLANDFACAGLAIPMDKKMETFEGRLEATRAAFKHASSPTMQVNYALQRGLNSLPVSMLRLVPPYKFTFLYTNLPGPNERLVIWDNELLETMLFLKPRKSAPVILFSIMSYNGMVRVGVTASSTFVRSQEEMDRIVRDLQDELGLMMTLKGGMGQVSNV